MIPMATYDGKCRIVPGWAIATAALAVLLFPPVAAKAGETANRPMVQEAAVTSGAKITKEQATEAALQSLPGDVTDVTIERKRGTLVYVIEIVAKKDGAETDVLVDMESGKVLGMDR